jgi:RNA 3'-terminal phosphate cyclase (ATP)
MRAAATAKLVATGTSPDIINITPLWEKGDSVLGHGSGIVLWAKTENGCILGGSAVGRKGLDAAEVGEAAATELLQNLNHGGCVDEYLQVRLAPVTLLSPLTFTFFFSCIGPNHHIFSFGRG